MKRKEVMKRKERMKRRKERMKRKALIMYHAASGAYFSAICTVRETSSVRTKVSTVERR